MSLRGSCTICTDYFDAEIDISATPCGHLFHATCLNQWISTCGAQRTCPQCRRVVVPKRIISKIFVNIPEESETQLDPYALKNKLDEMEVLFKKHKSEKSDLEDTLKAMEDTKNKLSNKVKQLKSDLTNKQNLIQLLNLDMDTLKTEVSYARSLKAEVKQLKIRLKTLEKVELCVNGQKSEVDEMLHQYSQNCSNQEAKQLTIFCVAMKQEYETIKESRSKLNSELMKLKRDLHKKEQLLLSKVSTCEELEKSVANLNQSEDSLAKENQSLKKKIQSLQLAISSPTDTKVSAINRLIAESPAPEFLTPVNGLPLRRTKPEQSGNSFAIKKPRLSTSFDSVEVDLNDSSAASKQSDKDSMVLFVPETPENSSKMVKNKVPKKSAFISKPAASQLQSFSNPHTIRSKLLKSSSKSTSVNAGYDGFGGHKRTSLQMSKINIDSSSKFSSVNNSFFKVNSLKQLSSLSNQDRFSRLKRNKHK